MDSGLSDWPRTPGRPDWLGFLQTRSEWRHPTVRSNNPDKATTISSGGHARQAAKDVADAQRLPTSAIAQPGLN